MRAHRYPKPSLHRSWVPVLLSSILSVGIPPWGNIIGTSCLPCCYYPKGAKVEPQSQEAWLSSKAEGPGLRLILRPSRPKGRSRLGCLILLTGSCGFSRKPPRLVTPTSLFLRHSHHPSDTFWAQFICTLWKSTAGIVPAPPAGEESLHGYTCTSTNLCSFSLSPYPIFQALGMCSG